MDRDIAGPWIFGPSDHVVEPGTRVELFPDIPAVALIDALASDNAMSARSWPGAIPCSKSTWPSSAVRRV